MSLQARFEHIALAVHHDDLAAWDRLLRGDLGGAASLGGTEPRAGFQGGQITYPDGGMLEVLSWTAGGEAGAMARYLEKQGARAALHHLTFLVEELDPAIEHAREVGYEPMIGRRSRTWNEFFVRDPGLRPKGMLIQVLEADKQTLIDSGWSDDWEPFMARHEPQAAPARIAGAHLASTDPVAASRLFTELLGARASERDGVVEIAAHESTMRVWLHPGEGTDGVHVEVAPEEGTRLAEGLGRSGLPAEAQSLVRATSD